MKNTIGKTALFLGLVWGGVMCTSPTKTNEQTTQKGNFKDFDVAYKQYEFEAKDAYTLAYTTGSKVRIPANAFIDSDGKPIAGKVQVSYREFHHATDIITAGITMEYDSAGKKLPFETAGMFDIRAEQAGKPVFLAKNKPINIDLASYKEGAFNFYYLHEQKKQNTTACLPFISQAIAQDVRPGENRWELLATSQMPQENKERKQKLAEINKKLPIQPAEPIPYDEKTPVFDLDIDVRDFPALRSFEGITWQYAGEANDNSQNPTKNEWIFEHQWANIQLEEEGEMQYRLMLSSASKKFQSLVRPTLKGVAYEKAKGLFAEKKKQYDAELKARAEELESLKAEKIYASRLSKFTRSLTIQNLGIYNCDRIYNDAEAIQFALEINAPNDPSAVKSEQMQIYLVVGKDAINYSARGKRVQDFRFNPNKPAKMLVLFSGSDKVGVYSQDDFKRITRGSKGKTVQIDLKTIDTPIKSTTALEEVLAKL